MCSRDPFSVNAREGWAFINVSDVTFVNTELKLSSKHEDKKISPEQKFFFCVD